MFQMRRPIVRRRGAVGRLVLVVAAVFCIIYFAGPLYFPGQSASVPGSGHWDKGKSGATFDECLAVDEQPNVEYWGDVVVAGADFEASKGLSTASSHACCLECQAARGCNIWSWCANPKSCGRQCWLKRVGHASEVEELPREKDENSGVPWTSGILHKDYDRDAATLPAVDTSIQVVSLRTNHGVMSIRLKPDWSTHSVDFVRRIAMEPEVCTTSCQFYRAEPGLLLQGSMRAFIPHNNVTKPGPKIMERGDVGWAGGSAGPHFFIYLGVNPATQFGLNHTVFGVVDDYESLQVADHIVNLPAVAPHPGDMHMLLEPEAFSFGPSVHNRNKGAQ